MSRLIDNMPWLVYYNDIKSDYLYFHILPSFLERLSMTIGGRFFYFKPILPIDIWNSSDTMTTWINNRRGSDERL